MVLSKSIPMRSPDPMIEIAHCLNRLSVTWTIDANPIE
jgi:hypothetical protein